MPLADAIATLKSRGAKFELSEVPGHSKVDGENLTKDQIIQRAAGEALAA